MSKLHSTFIPIFEKIGVGGGGGHGEGGRVVKLIGISVEIKGIWE